MKNIKDISIDPRNFQALSNSLRKPYMAAMRAAAIEGCDLRQVLASDVTKLDLAPSMAA